MHVKQRRARLVSGWVTRGGAGATGLVALMVGTIRFNNTPIFHGCKKGNIRIKIVIYFLFSLKT